LKAVKMGMVTAIALFWSNKPNPAIERKSNRPGSEAAKN
jgi:hypothetical protein